MYFLLLAAIVAIVIVVVLRASTPLANAFKPRLITLLGIVLILGSFFFQDWVRFDFIQYLRVGWDPLRELAPEAAGLFGMENFTPLLRVLLGAASLNGLQLALVPFFGLGTRAALVFPSLIALAALVWLPFGTSYSGLWSAYWRSSVWRWQFLRWTRWASMIKSTGPSWQFCWASGWRWAPG